MAYHIADYYSRKFPEGSPKQKIQNLLLEAIDQLGKKLYDLEDDPLYDRDVPEDTVDFESWLENGNFTDLQKSCFYGDIKSIREEKVWASQLNKNVAFVCAAAFGHIVAVYLLLGEASNEAKDFALFYAASGLHLQVVETLISAGARCPKDAVDRIWFDSRDVQGKKILDLLSRTFLPWRYGNFNALLHYEQKCAVTAILSLRNQLDKNGDQHLCDDVIYHILSMCHS